MIRLIKPYIAFEDVREDFEKIFESGIFTSGDYSRALPEAVCSYTGAKHAFNATSATTALAACLEMLNIGVGDEVIVADFSFPATANVVEACGATPVFADVDLATFNMLPDEVERKITPKTKAVIFVCALGNPDGLDKVLEICRAKNVPLINDAACGIGSAIKGRKVGSIADIACFSYHPRKLLTAGEGGSITTNNDAWADILRVKLAHGAQPKDGKLDFITYGYNYRLPELQCVMLMEQIRNLDTIVEGRNAIMDAYRAALEGAGYVAQTHGEHVRHNMQSIVFAMPDGLSRDGLIAHLRAREIESTIGTYCLSAGTYFKNKYNNVQKNALWLWQNTITLPCFEGLDVEQVTKAVLDYKG